MIALRGRRPKGAKISMANGRIPNVRPPGWTAIAFTPQDTGPWTRGHSGKSLASDGAPDAVACAVPRSCVAQTLNDLASLRGEHGGRGRAGPTGPRREGDPRGVPGRRVGLCRGNPGPGLLRGTRDLHTNILLGRPSRIRLLDRDPTLL